ncbi:MAG: dihydrodipicolinate synthase family protein [Bacteroidetes bacterium]|nr:dihydrodipicolinate synthase family protein [Bacteroidota bacterium]
MKIEHLKGLIAAPFTPMHADGSLNLSIVPGYYEMLKANGITGAFICGSTGEGVSMTQAEKKKVFEAWASASKDDNHFKVMPLVGGTSLNDCIELAKYAEECGLYAVAFTAPFYFKPANVQVLAETCRKVASAVPNMPFYYYHIPVLTGVGFTMFDLLNEIDGKILNFAGVKYTHEDFMDFLSCLNFKGGQYDMLWGRDENILAALALGARGSVGSTFNYAAPLYNELIASFEQGNLEAARKKQQQSIDMIRLLGKHGGIATGKAYMKLMKLDCGEFRLPVRNMSPEQFQLFKKDAEQIKFSSFCSQLPAASVIK